MIQQKVAELLNQQINKELYSAYLYLAFADFFTEKGLDGFANWYNIQAQEERDHALLFRQYMQNNSLKVTLLAIDQPVGDWKTDMDILKEAMTHEQYVTSLINTIYDSAHQVKDFRTMQFLDWFVKEQGEEEMKADILINKMNLFGTDPKGLYMLNAELAARVYAAPTLVL